MSRANAEADDKRLLEELEQDMAACRRLAPAEPAVPSAGMRERALRQIASEQGVAARLRSLPGPWRILVVLAVAAATAVASMLLTPRPDLHHYPGVRMAFVLALLFAFTFVAAWRVLRPLHRPPVDPLWDYAMLVAGGALPIVLAVWPGDYQGPAPADGAAFIAQCSACFGFGTVLGAPVLLLALVARRARLGGPFVAALAGVAAGLSGNVVLHLHCPMTDSGHLLLGHATVLAPLGIIAAVWPSKLTQASK